MRLSDDQCRAIATMYETTDRPIKSIARTWKTTTHAIREALRRAGVSTKVKPKAFRCQLCGRKYTHSFCAVCNHHGCAPVMELRKRDPYASEPGAREYAYQHTSRGTLFRSL